MSALHVALEAWIERTRRTKPSAPFRGAGILILIVSYLVAFFAMNSLQRTVPSSR